MAKQSGIGSSLFTGIYDLSGDVGAVTSLEISRGTFDVTPINASAMERIVGRRDGAISFAAFWNVTAGQAHPVLSALARTDVICSCFIGSTVGSAAASMTAKQLDYATNFGEDGSLGATVNMTANGYGLEWGEMLTTGKQSFATGTVSGTSVNLGAVSTLFGAAAYLQVFSVASGTATFAVQDSDDDASFANVTGLAFTGATGATTQRLQTAAGATIRQYVRVQGTGVHGAAVIAVNFVRYTEAGPI
jgi:hypothetical protein